MATLSEKERSLRTERMESLLKTISQFNEIENFSMHTYSELLSAMKTELNIEFNRINCNAK